MQRGTKIQQIMKRMPRPTGLDLLIQKTNFSAEKNALNTEIDEDKTQDNHFHFSNMNELRQPSTPLGVVNEILDETVIP